MQVLLQLYYYARHNVDEGNAQRWCRQPIFSFTDGHFACSYLRVLIDRAYALPELPDMTDEQTAALDYLEELAADPSLHVTLRQEPGDLLLLNNWMALHRRNEFEDHVGSVALPPHPPHLALDAQQPPARPPVHRQLRSDISRRTPQRNAGGGRQ